MDDPLLRHESWHTRNKDPCSSPSRGPIRSVRLSQVLCIIVGVSEQVYLHIDAKRGDIPGKVPDVIRDQFDISYQGIDNILSM